MNLKDFLVSQPDALSYLDYVEATRQAASTETKGTPLRLAILRNVTVETMLPVISGELLRAGFDAQIHLGDFDAIASETMQSDGNLYKFSPDFVFLCQWLENISPRLATRFTGLTADEVAAETARVLDTIALLVSAIRRNTNAPVLLNNFPLPSHPTLGILDAQQAHGQTRVLLALNAGLVEMAATMRDVYVVDFMRLSAQIGYGDFFDARQWQIARLPFGRRAQLEVGRELIKFVRALRGRSKKCLVLDCDNTLWGGVIGEDGIGGIELGTTYPGSCFQAFQREILNLHDRGVILALCSKNNEADVLEVLRGHPDMLIREEHLATWAINWNDKPANLRTIAAELNIGLDSLVFVDDNDFEVNFVRRELPQVATILLPKDRSRFAETLNAAGWFDSLTVTEEDRLRTASYKANVERTRLQQSATNVEEYLTSLGIVMTFGPPSDIEVPRVAQLSQKTNQFNLTTRRYTEGEIRSLREAGDARVYVMKARDNASELGLVGVIVARITEGGAEIDNCFISCRALGRGLEHAFMAAAANDIFTTAGRSRVIGRYQPTEKNVLCRDYLETCGFQLVDQKDGTTTWVLEALEQPIEYPAWITVEPSIEMVR